VRHRFQQKERRRLNARRRAFHRTPTPPDKYLGPTIAFVRNRRPRISLHFQCSVPLVENYASSFFDYLDGFAFPLETQCELVIKNPAIVPLRSDLNLMRGQIVLAELDRSLQVEIKGMFRWVSKFHISREIEFACNEDVQFLIELSGDRN